MGKHKLKVFGDDEELVYLSDYRVNPDNPFPKKSDAEFKLLKENLLKYPNFLYYRPIVVDDTGMALGGNKRFMGLVELGYEKVPKAWIRVARDFTKEEQRTFVIADNVNFGKWDEELLLENYTTEELEEWNIEFEELEEEEEQPLPKADSTETTNRIILTYSDDDYELVMNRFSALVGTKEEIVFNLLGL